MSREGLGKGTWYISLQGIADIVLPCRTRRMSFEPALQEETQF